MADLIYRQAAIYAIVNTVSRIGLHDNSEVARYGATFRQHEIIDIIESLPSAEPELDEWCTDCKEYDHERHCCPRWNRVIRETLKDVEDNIVRCMDCKHRYGKACDFADFWLKDDDYCSRAERKENG